MAFGGVSERFQWVLASPYSSPHKETLIVTPSRKVMLTVPNELGLPVVPNPCTQSESHY